jgi:hypothetical protein
MSVIHLFRIPQVVELTTATGAALMNYPVNRTDFVLARYVDNEIEFWVKNIDRKAVALTGSTLTMHISETSGKVLLTRELHVLDAAKGLVRLFISGEEAAAMPRGNVRYSIVMTRVDGVQVMLYTDRDRKGVGHIEVVEGPLPDPIQPIPLSLSDFLSRNGRLYSGPVPGAAMVHNVSGQHSVIIDFSAFTGAFTVQGTLDAQPGQTDTQWFDVKSVEYYEPKSGRVHIPFEGNLMNIRFMVTKIAGNIDLILFRN